MAEVHVYIPDRYKSQHNNVFAKLFESMPNHSFVDSTEKPKNPNQIELTCFGNLMLAMSVMTKIASGIHGVLEECPDIFFESFAGSIQYPFQ